MASKLVKSFTLSSDAVHRLETIAELEGRSLSDTLDRFLTGKQTLPPVADIQRRATMTALGAQMITLAVIMLLTTLPTVGVLLA